MKNYRIIFYSAIIVFSVNCAKNDSTKQIEIISLPVLSAVSVDFYEKRAGGTSAVASVLKNGGSPVIEKGIIWGTSPNLTLSSTNKIISQSGDSAMRESIRGMAINKNYYLKAFATNIKGTAYSEEISFTIPVDITWRDSTGLVIFYIYKAGEIGFVNGEIHGLMTGGVSVLSGGVFQCGNSIIGTSTAIGSGFLNTEKIIKNGSNCNSIGKNIVAFNNVTKLDGYSDWFIPSRDEFLKMREFNSKYNLLMSEVNTVGFWTSSEVDASSSWGVRAFNTTAVIEIAKGGYSQGCIPIRAF